MSASARGSLPVRGRLSIGTVPACERRTFSYSQYFRHQRWGFVLCTTQLPNSLVIELNSDASYLEPVSVPEVEGLRPRRLLSLQTPFVTDASPGYPIVPILAPKSEVPADSLHFDNSLEQFKNLGKHLLTFISLS